MRLLAEHSSAVGPVECRSNRGINLRDGYPLCPQELSDICGELFSRFHTILSEHFTDPEVDSFFIEWMIEEWRTNALLHGNRCDPQKRLEVSLRIEEMADHTARILFVCLIIADEGDFFDPEKIPDSTIDEQLEVPSGRGVQAAKALSLLRYGHSLEVCVDRALPPAGTKNGKSVVLKWAKFEEK